MDTRAFDTMVAGIVDRTGGLDAAAQDAAQEGVSMITGIPVDTGELEASLSVRMGDDGAEIYASAPHARYVFGGTRYMAARPPTFNADALAQVLADRVARQLFA